MGRKKKKNNRLRNLGLCALITTLGVYVYFSFMNVDIKMPDLNLGFPSKIKNESRIQQSLSVEDIIPKIEDKKGELPQVKIFFIGHQGGKEVYRPVYRENNSNRSNVEYAVRCLLSGPTSYEKNKGVYSEIPTTNLISIQEIESRVVINLSESFAQGGGADSLYKRMFQLIKTVNYNTNKPVYLLINGQMVEALGGEGLMIKQPLNGSSLDD